MERKEETKYYMHTVREISGSVIETYTWAGTLSSYEFICEKNIIQGRNCSILFSQEITKEQQDKLLQL